ncbi:MAG TPA: hypothetical protein VIL83_06450 [Capillibacterium sp.]
MISAYEEYRLLVAPSGALRETENSIKQALLTPGGVPLKIVMMEKKIDQKRAAAR